MSHYLTNHGPACISMKRNVSTSFRLTRGLVEEVQRHAEVPLLPPSIWGRSMLQFSWKGASVQRQDRRASGGTRLQSISASSTLHNAGPLQHHIMYEVADELSLVQANVTSLPSSVSVARLSCEPDPPLRETQSQTRKDSLPVKRGTWRKHSVSSRRPGRCSSFGRGIHQHAIGACTYVFTTECTFEDRDRAQRDDPPPAAGDETPTAKGIVREQRRRWKEQVPATTHGPLICVVDDKKLLRKHSANLLLSLNLNLLDRSNGASYIIRGQPTGYWLWRPG